MSDSSKAFTAGEVLLVHFQNTPAFFIRVEDISPDHKKGWWQMSFLTLTIPLKKITWILDEQQIRGADFTMGGNPVRIERIKVPQEETDETLIEETDSETNSTNNVESGNVVSMFDEE